MGRKEWERSADREDVFALIESGKLLTPEEIATIKETFTGCGGLVPSQWSHGQFFTPAPVVQFIHDLLDINAAPDTILEPSAGGGAFINGLQEDLCTCIEPHLRTSRVAAACFPCAHHISDLAENIFPYGKSSEYDGRFGYVIGNPPFGLKIEWKSYTLKKPKVRKTPSEEVFLEIAYKAAKPGGKIALILPDGVLGKESTSYLRKWLMERCFVRAVISLPTTTFYFTGTAVKTSVLYLEKFPEGFTKEDAGNYQVFMSICKEIGWDSRGRATKGSDLPEILTAWRIFQATGEVPSEELSALSAQAEAASTSHTDANDRCQINLAVTPAPLKEEAIEPPREIVKETMAELDEAMTEFAGIERELCSSPLSDVNISEKHKKAKSTAPQLALF